MKRTLTAAIALMAGTASAEGVLNLYNWGNYTSPELLEKFTAETGITVTVTDYDSNDTALAKIQAGGHGFDLAVPSANYMQIYNELGLIQPLDLSRLPNHANIAPEWMNVDWDPGRTLSVPWQWGVTGVSVNTSIYAGDINTSAIWLEPPAELVGKINVTPEMNDIISMAIHYVGGEVCSEDLDILRQVRDLLVAAKPNWLSMDYGMTEKMAAGDVAATVYWNGAMMRSRIENPAVAFGYPVEGYPIFMDSVVLLSDAQNVDEAYAFINFIMAPENAAMLSAFARYANGISGSEAFMPEDMATAPEIVIPEELRGAGYFLPACPASANELYTAIWTELQG
jgi:spermidine/putrescine transport system substrate-binding protein